VYYGALLHPETYFSRKDFANRRYLERESSAIQDQQWCVLKE